MHKPDRLCVNFFSGPNGGKTLKASRLFVRLKELHVDSDLVAEFPKDLVLEQHHVALTNQIYVMANQLFRIQCAYYNTKVAIVDSPILLSAVYHPNTSEHLTALVFEQHAKLNNLNIVLSRDLSYPHSMVGRVHSLTESISIDNQIISLLEDRGIPYIRYDDFGEDRILDIILDNISDDNQTSLRQE